MVNVQGNVTTSEAQRREVNLALANMPLKLWIKLRMYNARARRADPKTEKGKLVIEKYKNILEKFLSV